MSTPSPLAGPAAPKKLPKVGAEVVLLHADRFNRSAEALDQWARDAKKCVEYYEGKQWTDADIAKLESEGRPALTINKIRPLVNLVWGYHLTNQTDIKFLPGHDQLSSAQVADTLNAVEASIREINQMPHVDSEVFIDSILTGRGFYRTVIDWSENILGEIKTTAQDPFSTYLDPDLLSYDLNDGAYCITSRWVSPEEVEFVYGKQAMQAVRPLVSYDGTTSFPTLAYDGLEEITPWRRFGGERDVQDHYWQNWSLAFHNMVDKSRKQIRLLDIEHWVPVERWCFLDLETGDLEPAPDHWTKEKIQKVLAYAQQRGDPIALVVRKMRRLRITHMIGDVVVYDAWAPYQSMTLTPFYAYFRRGQTRGLVHDLLGPQDEVNKRRASRLNIVNRMAGSGWIYEKESLDAQQRENLRKYGSSPGFHVAYDSKGGTLPPPNQIQPGTTPVAMSQLEQESEDDLRLISGVNESALGIIESANASGRAVEARQRQAVVGLENFIANYRRSKELLGRKHLNLIQKFYTQQRIVRTTGGDRARTPEKIEVNKRTAQGIINNLTIGRYQVAVDETPASKNFLEAQFEELLRLKELQVPIPDDYIIEASSIGRKEELLRSLKEAREAQALAAAGPAGPAIGGEGDAVAAAEPGAPAPPVAAE